MKRRRKEPEDPVVRVRDALASGRLRETDLTARGLGRFLGKTSSVLYRRWGSLEGFLYAVSLSAMAVLNDELLAALQKEDGLRAVAKAYVGMAVERPALFHLALTRRFDWKALRKARALNEKESFRAFLPFVEVLQRRGSPRPLVDARLFHAAVHGIALLTSVGRMNAGNLGQTDADASAEVLERLGEVFGALYRGAAARS